MALASPSIAPTPTPDGREPLPYSDVQSHGVATVEFGRPLLPSIDLPLVCEWISPSEVGYFYVAPSPVLIGGEDVSFWFEPRSPGNQFRIGREDAASYGPGQASGLIGLETLSTGWIAGKMRFEFTVDPWHYGPLEMPIEDWVRPLGNDPSMRWLAGTVTWACEPAPSTVLEPVPDASVEPGPTFPPLPRLRLVTDNAQREAVSGCGASIDIAGYTAADSCGPSFQGLGVDYVVRIRAGDNLRFVLPPDWRFERWSLGWVSQIEAERWHADQPDTFETVRTGEATNGRVLEVDAPPRGDWSVRLDWTGVRNEDSFAVPDYFRVLVE